MLQNFLQSISSWDRGQTISNWEQNTSYKKSYQPFWRKKISILTGLTGSSLACKYVFYRSEHNAKEGETQWNWILKVLKWGHQRAKQVDGKNEVIYLVIIFISQVMVINMSKMAYFLYFLLMPAKNQSRLGENIYVHLKDLIYLSQKMLWIIKFSAIVNKILTLENTVSLLFADSAVFYIFTLDISQTVTPEPMNHTIF